MDTRVSDGEERQTISGTSGLLWPPSGIVTAGRLALKGIVQRRNL